MAIKSVYQATAGDGRSRAYLEVAITDANDLPNIKAMVNTKAVDPAPGSIAYTAGLALIYQMSVDGTWTAI